jgi:DNA-binding response OmpR family regulator
MKILYVEDTLLNLCLIERIARMGSHQVINYASAELALRNFEQDRPDLVLVDIRLEGEMSGVELIQRLRSAGNKQPVVVITAITTDEMRERCLLVGANEYFTKPVSVRDLLNIIQRHEKTIADRTKETQTQETPASETQTQEAQAQNTQTQETVPDDKPKIESPAEGVSKAESQSAKTEQDTRTEESPPDAARAATTKS